MTTTTEPSVEAVKRRPFWRRFVAFVVRWTYRVVATMTILTALFVLVARTDVVHNWLRTTLLNLANGALQGSVEAEDIRIDIFHGIVLDQPVLSANGTTVLKAEQISVSYDLAALFVRVAAINEVRIVSPEINILRSADSVWNISRITKPSADTTTSAPPNGTILVRALHLTNGTITVDDRTEPWSDGTWFDPLHQKLSDVHLHISARLQLAENDASIVINGFSFTNHNGPVDVEDLQAIIRTSQAGVDVQSLRLITPRNDIAMRASIRGVNLLSGFSDTVFATHPIEAHIEADKVWGPDLHYFLTDVDLADGYSLYADATFWGNRIDVDDLLLTAGDARIIGRVTVDQLSGEKPVWVDIAVQRSSARYADVRRRLKFVELPELPFLERTSIDNLVLKGHPDDSLWFAIQAADAPGRVDGEMSLYFTKRTLAYEVDMKIGRGDLSVFSSDHSSPTNLNGRVMMVGSGVTLQELEGTTQIELDRSDVVGRQVKAFRTMIRSNGKGVITVDTLYADLTPYSRDTTTWLGDIDENTRQTVSLHGMLNAADPDRLRYSASIRTARLDLSLLLEDAAMPQRLSASVDIDAEGTELDSLLGSASASVSQLAMADRAMMPFTVDIVSQRTEETRTLSLMSNLGHATIHGVFVPSTLIDAITTSSKSLSAVVKDRIRHIVKSESLDTVTPIVLKPMNVQFDIDMLETSPFNMALADVAISGRARFIGRMTTTPNDIEATIDTLDLRHFSITSDSLAVYSDPMTASAGYRIVNTSVYPKIEWMTLRGDCDSVITINENTLTRPRIDFRDEKDTMRVNASTGFNTMNMSVDAVIAITQQEAVVRLDSAFGSIDPEKGLEWRLIRPSIISISSGVAHFQDFAVQRPWAETVTISGFVSDELFKGLVVRIENFPLRDIPKFAELDEEHPVRLLDGLVNEAVVSVDGGWKEPVISTRVSAQDVRYNGALIGTLAVALQHENRNVTGTATIDDPTLKTENRTLSINVKALPLDLAFVAVDQRLVDDRAIDIELNARKLALAAVEPFLPAVERVRGTADASISVRGTTPTDISLSGTGNFKNAYFLASSTNIVYQAEGVMRLKDSELLLDTIRVRNVERDLRGGVAIASGTVVFDGLAVDSVDFNVTTPTKTGIAIMNMASQARSPDIYGDLVIRSGKRPIRLYGKLTSPKLVGDIVVRYADIVFPKERSTTKSRLTAFSYSRKDPNLYYQESLVDKAKKASRPPIDTSQSKDTTSTLQAVVTEAISKIIEPGSEDFIDILVYDLDIYLEGRTLLTMIFGTFEILVADLELADLKVPLTFTGRFGNNSTNLRGKVRVREGASTYKFYKPFQTSGTLNFTAGGMVNPELDLKAVYEDRRMLENNETEEYKVELTITGTKLKPNISYRVWRKNREVTGDSAKIASDALMLILVGKTQDELLASGEGDFVGQVNAAMSAVATSALSDMISGVGIIQNAQLDVGSDISQSRLTLSGQLFGDVSYRVSGQISDFSGNSTFTVSVPLSVLADEEALRLFRMDFSQTVNNSSNITRQTRLWEIKLGARLP